MTAGVDVGLVFGAQALAALEIAVILHTDIPTRAQIDQLLVSRAPWSVSIYTPTDPASDGTAERIEFRNLAAQAIGQLRDAGAPRPEVAVIDEELTALGEEEEFWRYQARSLAVFATPQSTKTFRLANRLMAVVEVSDRFYVKPLLRAHAFPQVAFVLALAQGSVRLVEIDPDTPPSEVRVPDLPANVADASGRASIADRAPVRRVQGSEGQKVRMRSYARQVDQALRPILNGLDVPLILAAGEPLASIFRSVNSYPHLVAATIPGNPETTPDAELGSQARRVLDELYAVELRGLKELYDLRVGQGRASSDIAEVARSATYGAVETLLVDIDAVVPGLIDEETGELRFGEPDAGTYGVLDEIARRVWLGGGRVVAVRAADIPSGGEVAALLRYAPFGR